MKKKAIPAIHVPIQNADGSMQWVWYMFFQWIAENAGAADLSDYFTKEEVNALLDEKVTITDEADKVYGTDDEGEQYFYDLSYFAADDNVVHKSGDEEINGTKTFNTAPRLRRNLTPSTTATKPSAIEDILLSPSGNTNGYIDGVNIIRYQRVDGKREVRYRAGFRNTANTGNLWPSVNVGVNPDDTTYVDLSTSNNSYNYAKTPTDNDVKDAQIATTLWVYRNRSTYTTNCITEIPQDINLELNNSALILKAGSRVYIPNGTGVFNTFLTSNDISATFTTNGTHLVGFAPSFGTITAYLNAVSGGTEPTTLTNGLTWYDTTNNVIKRAWGGSWQASLFSLPVCIVTVSGGAISSIDQVFNGFGYIGSSVYVLPGVKCLAPYGRTANGTLRSYDWTCSSVIVRTETFNDKRMLAINCAQNNIGWADYVYNEKENYNYSSGTISDRRCLVGSMTIVNGKIESLSIDSTFHAVDYNDFADLSNEVDGLSNKDLSNLSSIGKNIANWSSNVTNCITEIPQDIKLELSAGTLTLKAGSKVYMPNGSGVFDTIDFSVDKTITNTTNGTYLICATTSGMIQRDISRCVSGATRSLTTTYMLWYDTTNNVVNNYGSDSSTPTQTVSLPIAVITVSGGQITSIDQVFNGFGYIGSTVFVLPGIKGLIPSGRNADGTLNNGILNITSVLTYTNTSAFDRRDIIVRNNGISPTSVYFDVEGNRNRRTDNNNIVAYVNAGIISATTGGVITSFSPKYAFQAVDYSDYQKTVSQVDTNTANIALKQDEATAVNYDNITNCITEIPQNINLTLSNGTLTLKAGSKVYVPNGVGVFNVVSVTTDRTVTNTSNGQKVIYTNATGTNVGVLDISAFSSGGTMPSGTWKIWYDTTNNLVKKIEGTAGVVAYNCAFPLGVVTVSNGAISSIDQVFNGFGYIGSTVFALPGVKGLIPNGRNTDGTLKNESFTTSSVLTNTLTSTLSSLNNIRIRGTTLQVGSLVYDEIYNYNRLSSSGDTRTFATAGYIRTTSGGKITSFSTKYAFRAVNYSDSEYIANCAMPSARYIDLTLGATQSNYTAPADGYVTFTKVSATGNQVVVLSNITAGGIGSTAFSIEGNQWLRASIPVSKGDVFTAEYSATGDTKAFRFVYANGSK